MLKNQYVNVKPHSLLVSRNVSQPVKVKDIVFSLVFVFVQVHANVYGCERLVNEMLRADSTKFRRVATSIPFPFPFQPFVLTSPTTGQQYHRLANYIDVHQNRKRIE